MDWMHMLLQVLVPPEVCLLVSAGHKEVPRRYHVSAGASLGINNRRQCVGQKFKEFMSLLMLLQFLMMLTIWGVSH